MQILTLNLITCYKGTISRQIRYKIDALYQRTLRNNIMKIAYFFKSSIFTFRLSKKKIKQ